MNVHIINILKAWNTMESDILSKNSNSFKIIWFNNESLNLCYFQKQYDLLNTIWSVLLVLAFKC